MTYLRTAAVCGVLCLPLVLATAAPADDEKKPLVERRPAGEPTTDQEFLARAIACEVANVKFAERASRNASSEDVRKMADTVAEEHKKIRDSLIEQAKKMRLGVVEGLDKEHRDQYDRMSKLEGKEFDREYVRCLVEGHEKSAKLYKKWAKDAKDAGVREAAEAAAAKVNDHLDHARKLQAKVRE
jgi:putative membrane protein